VRNILAVDLSKVIHVTPKKPIAARDNMLPPDRFAEQRTAGTWSALFTHSLLNRYPWLGLGVWYLACSCSGGWPIRW
jgi:hypothetical protein